MTTLLVEGLIGDLRYKEFTYRRLSSLLEQGLLSGVFVLAPLEQNMIRADLASGLMLRFDSNNAEQLARELRRIPHLALGMASDADRLSLRVSPRSLRLTTPTILLNGKK